MSRAYLLVLTGFLLAAAPIEASLWAPVQGLGPTEQAALDAELREHAQALARALKPVGPIDALDAEAVLRARVAARLKARQAAGLVTTPSQAHTIILGFEAYKAQTYVTSGVYPRTYFGYLDADGDTAAEELRVVRAVRASTDAANAWLAEQGLAWRVTDQEIAITWIAEGGALMLETRAASRRPIHPILDIGLDDIAHGFKELPGLVGRLDAAAGTHVEDIPQWEDGRWSLRRSMTLEESVVGTAIMWVWEMRIADRKLREAGRPTLDTYDASDRFILASLVYNSGLIHSPSRPAQVRRHSLASHLSGIAKKHNPGGRRAHLPVVDEAQALARLLVDRDYPYQGTSWIALYHIQQRYGGFEAVSRFTDTFDEAGRFDMAPWDALAARLAAEREAREQPTPVIPLEPAPPRSTGWGCRSLPSPMAGGIFALVLGLTRRRREPGKSRVG